MALPGRTAHLTHRDGRLDPRTDGVDPAAQAEEVEALVLLPDRVGGVDLGAFGVALLEGLWDRRRVSCCMLSAMRWPSPKVMRWERGRIEQVTTGG